MVRCKMKVTAVNQSVSQWGDAKTRQETSNVELSVVQDAANKTWAKYTPGGTVKLQITNPDAFEQFKIGEMFFVDFTIAPSTEAEESK